MKKVLLFTLCLVLCFGAAWLGSAATLPQIDTWYASLRKPVFNPPNWVFGPVWSLLYFLMAVSLYNILVSDYLQKARVIRIFIVQLVLNVLWSFIFFKWHLLTLAAFEIIVLLYFVIYYTVVSKELSKTASICFIPYLVWVTFASVLTISILALNYKT